MSLEAQEAIVTLKPGEVFRPEKLREAVKKADFPTRDFHIKATGEVVPYQGKGTAQVSDLAFKIPGLGQTFLLVPPPPPKKDTKEEKQAKTLDLLPRLKEAFKEGKKKFTVTGRVHEYKDPPLGLSVEVFEAVQQKG